MFRFKSNIHHNKRVPVEVKIETPAKQLPKYPIQDKLLYENWESNEVPRQCLEVKY
jgi:hypothetical protein